MVADDSLGHVSLDPSTQQSFDLRWEHYLPDLWIGLSRVYGDRADETLQRIRAILLKRCAERPDDLKRLDEKFSLVNTARREHIKRLEEEQYPASSRNMPLGMKIRFRIGLISLQFRRKNRLRIFG